MSTVAVRKAKLDEIERVLAGGLALINSCEAVEGRQG